MPTYNRLDRLRIALEGLERQTVGHGRFEVVIVSDGSTDGTDAFLKTVHTSLRLRCSFQVNAGPAAARNTGVQMARGQIILFVDDDVVAQPDLVAQHLLTHQKHTGKVVVMGPMLTPSDHPIGPYVDWEQAMLYKQYGAMSRGDFEPTFRQFYTGNASVRRDLLLAAGPFDERFRRAEDIELAFRLAGDGARFIFNESAIGYHYATRSFEAWLQIAHDYGANDVVLSRHRGPMGSLQTLRREYELRHRLVRLLTRVCIGRPRLDWCVRIPLRAVASLSYRLRLETISRQALSALYNTAYYSAFSDELGGRDAFHRLMESGPSTQLVAPEVPARSSCPAPCGD
jgi:glycosyltransferase involved in cell wall biosynthesis